MIGGYGAVEGLGSVGLVDARGVREVEGLGRRGRWCGGSGGLGERVLGGVDRRVWGERIGGCVGK